ncbi:Uncharacterised protein [Serratia fonticola]|uniref:Uncharacterized protein n=1 Tax=Serratia fonticola TaxID=47917 RepID=A0A4U9VCA2_SERFO|nr:Uncharacterised protein [Serratia fonticola]
MTSINYRVYVRTKQAELMNKAGKKFPIVPGMVASVEIKTGAEKRAGLPDQAAEQGEGVTAGTVIIKRPESG